MKAWRIYGIGDMRLDDVPVPKIKPGWVLVKVRMVQPSVTEVQWSRGISATGVANMKRFLQEKAPLQMFGHEFCGNVVEVPEGVSHVKVGDRVIYWRRAACHKCALCLAGYEEFCHKGPALGIDIPGCLAEYVLLPAESIISIPDSITDSEATTMQPLAGAAADLYAAGIEMGDAVVVLGQGVMGLNLMQLSRACGAGKTITVDVRDDALALSSQLGADIVINATKTDPVEAVLEATRSVGADIAFDCAGGNPQQGLSGTKTLTQATKMVRDQGKIVLVAMLEANATLEVSPISMRGIQYRGHATCTWKLMRYTIDLVTSKRLQLVPLVTHVLEGLDKVTEAFEITSNKAKYKAINPAQVIVSR